MSTEETTSAKDDRELDALVAECVMGWLWFTALGDSFLVPPFGHETARSFHVHWEEGKLGRPRFDIELSYPDHYWNWKIPPYSTDIASAMLVEERIAELGENARRRYANRLRDIVRGDPVEDVTLFKCIHATPRQRCEAALAAIEATKNRETLSNEKGR